MTRRIAGSVAAIAFLLALAAPVMAGGWADIVADAQTGPPPIEGRPIVIGFKVMQHGVTPAPWETATVHLAEASSGDSIEVVATNDDPNGHFSASVTLPHAGFWSWHVTLANLQSTQVPPTVSVRAADGRAPIVEPATLFAAIDRAKDEIRDQVESQVGQQVDELGQRVDVARARITSLEAQVNVLRDEKTRLATRVAAMESGDARLPVLAIVTLAVLAGAVAGFSMTWLAGRPGVTPTAVPGTAAHGPGPA
ncbi:MAG TPA: hypothetical protein VFJ80_08745 [Candidatus Limnocylindrales bacterium]|jgi:hypothetical protein|nr:hypothetical protein [Candidatus Limnocylindrales bacterium]